MARKCFLIILILAGFISILGSSGSPISGLKQAYFTEAKEETKEEKDAKLAKKYLRRSRKYYSEGVYHEWKRDIRLAYSFDKQTVDEMYGRDLYYLGNLIYNNQRVEKGKRTKIGLDLLMKGAAQGSMESMLDIGKHFDDLGQHGTAIVWYKKCAQQQSEKNFVAHLCAENVAKWYYSQHENNKSIEFATLSMQLLPLDKKGDGLIYHAVLNELENERRDQLHKVIQSHIDSCGAGLLATLKNFKGKYDPAIVKKMIIESKINKKQKNSLVEYIDITMNPSEYFAIKIRPKGSSKKTGYKGYWGAGQYSDKGLKAIVSVRSKAKYNTFDVTIECSITAEVKKEIYDTFSTDTILAGAILGDTSLATKHETKNIVLEDTHTFSHLKPGKRSKEVLIDLGTVTDRNQFNVLGSIKSESKFVSHSERVVEVR